MAYPAQPHRLAHKLQIPMEVDLTLGRCNYIAATRLCNYNRSELYNFRDVLLLFRKAKLKNGDAQEMYRRQGNRARKAVQQSHRLPMAHTEQHSITSQPRSDGWWLAMLGCCASVALVLQGVFNLNLNPNTGISPAIILCCGVLTAVFGGAWLPTTAVPNSEAQNDATQKLRLLPAGRWLIGLLMLFLFTCWTLLAVPMIVALKLTLAVGLLLVLCCTLKLWMARSHGSNASALLLYLLVMISLTLAPITLGPTAELMAQQPWVTDIVIALSPYSYLASWLGHDYLREPWFYQHTPLGSLEFNYPSATSLSLIYLGLTAALFTKLKTTTNSKPH